MGWGNLGSNWQYSRWVKNLARNARITNPVALGFEEFVYRIFVLIICDPSSAAGTRPWLTAAFRRLSVAAATDQYNFDPTVEPLPVIIKAVEIIGRDFKKIPITDPEKGLCDAVFAFTNNRRYGTKPYFGNVGGSTVTVP